MRYSIRGRILWRALRRETPVGAPRRFAALAPSDPEQGLAQPRLPPPAAGRLSRASSRQSRSDHTGTVPPAVLRNTEDRPRGGGSPSRMFRHGSFSESLRVKGDDALLDKIRTGVAQKVDAEQSETAT